jgi:3-oxoacyl-[acyl-carrier-protein] synthase II
MHLTTKIHITSSGIICALGHDENDIWNGYLSEKHFLKLKKIGLNSFWVGEIPDASKEYINDIAQQSLYQHLDPSVLYALFCARKMMQKTKWTDNEFGINIGSSRGATQRWESHFEHFSKEGIAQTLSSPLTTLGNLSSWVARDLNAEGPVISHSMTCSTSLQAVLNGVAWLQSGMSDRFLVGGTEASITPFTLAQMKALKIYAPSENETYPCRALAFTKVKNTMVLGEGTALFALEKQPQTSSLATIIGVGFANEQISHPVSMSSDALCFQKSMKMALNTAQLDQVDVIVMHAPGTKLGDNAELTAINTMGLKSKFTSNKWKIGHTFGASGALSLDLGIRMLQHQYFVGVPFAGIESKAMPIKHIMVNAVGFGGNAVSIILERA